MSNGKQISGGPTKAGVAARMAAAARAELRARTRRVIESLLLLQDGVRRRLLTAGHAHLGHFVCTLQVDVIRRSCRRACAKRTARPYRSHGRRGGPQPCTARVL